MLSLPPTLNDFDTAGRPPIKLIVTDLDGTVVQHDLSVSHRVQKAINTVCINTDVRVVIATGRMFPSALPYSGKLGLDTPIITYQGAMVRQSSAPHSVLYHEPVPLTLAKQVLALCRELDLHLNVYINDKLYTEPHPIYVEEYRATAAIEPNVVEPMENVLMLPPTKLVVIDNDPDKLLTMKEELGLRFGKQTLGWCQSRRNFLEITAPQVSKWRAVMELADIWAIRPEEILCIGDQDNDSAMIEQAGLGVAMGNAPRAVKAKADVITGSIDEDGAAQAIEALVLNPLLTLC